MNTPQSQIRRMRADVDRLVEHPDSGHAKTISHERHVALVDVSQTMMLKMRQLRLGEKRRPGDLWFDQSTKRLVPLHLPWWHLYGTITENHVQHFRILP